MTSFDKWCAAFPNTEHGHDYFDWLKWQKEKAEMAKRVAAHEAKYGHLFENLVIICNGEVVG